MKYLLFLFIIPFCRAEDKTFIFSPQQSNKDAMNFVKMEYLLKNGYKVVSVTKNNKAYFVVTLQERKGLFKKKKDESVH